MATWDHVVHQRWEHLLFLHWPIKPQEVAPLLPPGLEPDRFQGHAYVGVVPFAVTENRLRGLPFPLSPSFHEVNTRTYVRGPDGQAGVWFFSLDASSELAVRGAKAAYHLPYRHALIRFATDEPSDDGSSGRWMAFDARRSAGDRPDCSVRYRPAGAPQPAPAGTLEHFLVERYLLFAWTGERLIQARVRHEPYPLQPAALGAWSETLVGSAGLRRPGQEPLAHYAAAVTPDIQWPRPAA